MVDKKVVRIKTNGDAAEVGASRLGGDVGGVDGCPGGDRGGRRDLIVLVERGEEGINISGEAAAHAVKVDKTTESGLDNNECPVEGEMEGNNDIEVSSEGGLTEEPQIAIKGGEG